VTDNIPLNEHPRNLDPPIEEEIARVVKPASFRTQPKEEDPSVTVEQQALSRARKLVDEMRGGTLQQLTELRDTVDDLMRAITAKSEEVEEHIGELASMVRSSVKLVGDLKPRVEEQAKTIRNGLGTPPARTVTTR
jgi:polyhydroxyalkanoate synthesis regulator phasin